MNSSFTAHKRSTGRNEPTLKGKTSKSMPQLTEEGHQPAGGDLQTYGRPRTRKPFPIKKVIGIFLAVLIVAVLLWYAPTIISTVRNLFPQSSYTKVPVVARQISNVKFGNNEYFFMYQSPPWVQGSVFSISTPSVSANTHPAVEGATYRDFGLEIKVSEVYADYIVLMVRPIF